MARVSKPIRVNPLTPTSAEPCLIHKTHHPRPLYVELHHSVPRAWQYAWSPSAAVARKLIEEQDDRGDALERLGEKVPVVVEANSSSLEIVTAKLWDPRTVPLCRTSHGNVHWLLVRFMRRYEAMAEPNIETVVREERAWALKMMTPFSAHEAHLAETGMRRFVAASGDLLTLCKQGLYGEI